MYIDFCLYAYMSDLSSMLLKPFRVYSPLGHYQR